MNLLRPPSTELLQFLTGYVTLRCDLVLWPFDLGVMSRDATWVVNPFTKFEHDRLTVPELGQLQFSIGRQLKVPIFTFFLGQRGSNFKFNLSNPQKALPWRKRRIMTYWALGCVQKCDLWACQRKEKKDRNFRASNWLFAQTTHVDIGPCNFAFGVVSGKLLYISSFMKIGPGVSEFWRVENPPLPLTRLVLPYKPWFRQLYPKCKLFSYSVTKTAHSPDNWVRFGKTQHEVVKYLPLMV